MATLVKTSNKLGREDFRKQKEVEEARKAGRIPAEVDEEGNEINPHIPQYISKAPWYMDIGVPTLRHQKVQKEQESFGDIKDWYQRGIKIQTATKYRPGACENCGAMTHKTKECLERPRKLGAKWTGKDISPDEIITQVKLDFDGKRDRWNGYDPENYNQVVENFEFIENQRKKLKEEEVEKKLKEGTLDSVVNINDDDTEEKYAEESDLPGQKVDLKSRTTVRNLRIREDTAKYLRNLDPGSAYYDPKSRSMRENPNKDEDPSQLTYAGDNFVRYSGEAKQINDLQLFCWDAERKGLDAHLQGAPSQAEKVFKQFQETKKSKVSEMNKTILEKYGGEEYLKPLPKDIIATEQYVEYSKSGDIIKGAETPVPRSKYEEDVYMNNHQSVWGSFWHSGKWGYACCHCFIKNSYCTGEEGKVAHQEYLALQQNDKA